MEQSAGPTGEVPLPPRRARLHGRFDVVVVGGGPAGLGAAIGAARAGASVLLAERYGFLGGNATAALVMPLVSFCTWEPRDDIPGQRHYFPEDHGPGRPVVGGVLRELVERLVEEGGALPPSADTGFVVPFDPEVFKCVALELVEEAGVNLLLHSLAGDVIWEGSDKGVILETKSGPLLVRGRVIVDATGDADIACRAGALCEVGRMEDGLTQPMTLMFRLQGFDRGEFDRYLERHPGQWCGVQGLWELVRDASRSGELDLPREDLLFFATPHPGEIIMNCTRVAGRLGTDVEDLTLAEREGRRQMKQLVQFLKRRVPGFRDAYVVQSGAQVGVRETRRVRGGYTLTAEDVLRARRFPDVVARGAYPMDIHDPSGKGTTLQRLPRGRAYDIPLRCLLPLGVDGLLVAGRCISGTHEAMSSYRVMPIAMATGQAAGVCGALAAAAGGEPREVEVERVQAELRRQGALLGGDDGHTGSAAGGGTAGDGLAG